MSLVTRSVKRNRVYRRKFDHERAQKLRREGMSYQRIADLMGVSYSAVRRVCDEAVRKRMDIYASWWPSNAGRCEICGTSCSSQAHRASRAAADGRTLCRKCRGEARQTRFRHDADGMLEIRCRVCRQWKGASEFPADRNVSRGYHRDCRECGTKARAARRERRKVPCVRCGKPRSHPNDNLGNRGLDTGLCRKCWRDSRKATA